MVKISYVTTCPDPGGGALGTLLDIHFDNEQTLLLSLKSKQNDPAFLRLYQDGDLNRPKTDGDSVYWQAGPRLSFSEIMEMTKGDVNMTKGIVRVDALDERSDSISVELENGSIVILEFISKHSNPLFAGIKDLSLPKTDGERVYWANGASLTLDEIMERLQKSTAEAAVVG